jgi:DNA-directed RNA polymerase
MKNKLRAALVERISTEIAPQNPLKYLKNYDIDLFLDTLISVVYLYTREKRGIQNQSIYMVEIISAIGHSVRSKLKQKRDSSLAAKTGAFLLWSFEQMQILQVVLGQGNNKHQSYIVQILDDDSICAMWENVPSSQIEKLPSLEPYLPWQSTRHKTGMSMIKTGNVEVLAKVTLTTHPILFACLNRAQTVGWNVNEDIYKIQQWALRNKTDAFSNIWEQTNAEAKTTKLREAKAIGSIAKRFLGSTFYHLYYYDFRGRKYPTTAYLHEQGSDLARGLLLRADSKVIGEAGFFWLLISIASNWAGDAGREDGAKTDKIPLKDRFCWVVDNEEIILSYAESPKVSQGWMHADKPWQFLAACNELKKLREWQTLNGGSYENYEYESSLEVYIDGSNNGSQHLSALTLDEITAVHVNLVPSDLPGDLYKYVADHVWEGIQNHVEQMDDELFEDCNEFIDTLIDYKKQIQATEPKSDQRKVLIEEIKAYKELHREVAELAAPVYWMRVVDPKYKRKIVKRNVMTLPYGGTAYGLGQQQIDDSKKHGIDQLLFMEHKWGAFLGKEVYNDCKISLKRPMQLLSVFEQAGKAAELRGDFLSWTVPVTDFPVVQNYTEGKVKKIYVQYGPPKGDRLSTGYFTNTLQLAICFIEDVYPSKGKQAQGASPNAIHSLDAAHLAITVALADFSVTTIHDSFGCLLADMPELFRIIRETFVQLYASDPLGHIMADIDGDISEVQFGTLDLTLILDSEYCFV